jgi:hypothetical protein
MLVNNYNINFDQIKKKLKERKKKKKIKKKPLFFNKSKLEKNILDII